MYDPLRIEEQFRRAHDDEDEWLAWCEETGVYPGVGYVRVNDKWVLKTEEST
jgi:LPS sulfotransferase NodH